MTKQALGIADPPLELCLVRVDGAAAGFVGSDADLVFEDHRFKAFEHVIVFDVVFVEPIVQVGFGAS